jgi:hypothetical protein
MRSSTTKNGSRRMRSSDLAKVVSPAKAAAVLPARFAVS